MFFIVGVGRSGTSLLQSILSTHSKICLPPETGFTREKILSKNRLSNFSKNDILERHPKLARIAEALNNIPVSTTWSNEIDFYKEMLESYRNLQKKEKIGDKDPKLVEYISSISTLFPQSKFIHIIRDPRDVLISKKMADWSKDKSSWKHIFANYIQLKMGTREGQKINKFYKEVYYEDLLIKTKKTISNICDFLIVDFEPEMLSFQETANKLVSEQEKQWKKETMGPLLKNNSGKWVGKLKEWEVALIELLCEETFRQRKYNKSKVFNNLPFLVKIKVNTLWLTLKLLGIVYFPFRLYSQKLLVYWKY